MTNPLNPLFDKVKRLELASVAQAAAEASLVDWTYRRLRCDHLLKQEKRRLRGEMLSFSHINDLLRFPMTFGYTRLPGRVPIHKDPESIHPAWFKTFNSLPVVKVYDELFDSADTTRPFGLVFPRKGFAQGLIIHNGDLQLFVPASSCCHFYRGDGRRKKDLVVQPYSILIDGIRDSIGWSP